MSCDELKAHLLALGGSLVADNPARPSCVVILPAAQRAPLRVVADGGLLPDHLGIGVYASLRRPTRLAVVPDLLLARLSQAVAKRWRRAWVGAEAGGAGLQVCAVLPAAAIAGTEGASRVVQHAHAVDRLFHWLGLLRLGLLALLYVTAVIGVAAMLAILHPPGLNGAAVALVALGCPAAVLRARYWLPERLALRLLLGIATLWAVGVWAAVAVALAPLSGATIPGEVLAVLRPVHLALAGVLLLELVAAAAEDAATRLLIPRLLDRAFPPTIDDRRVGLPRLLAAGAALPDLVDEPAASLPPQAESTDGRLARLTAAAPLLALAVAAATVGPLMLDSVAAATGGAPGGLPVPPSQVELNPASEPWVPPSELSLVPLDGVAVAGTDGSRFTLRQEPAGDVVLPSGRLVASDALVVFGNTPPFTTPVPPGRHPVVLTLATTEAGDERVAFARVVFAAGPVARWEIGARPGQDPAQLRAGQIFGYAVDSGSGCFLDASAAWAVDTPGYAGRVIAARGGYDRRWASVELDPASQANVVVFDSGWGDGHYATYFGYAADGQFLVAVTDFAVLDRVAPVPDADAEP